MTFAPSSSIDMSPPSSRWVQVFLRKSGLSTITPKRLWDSPSSILARILSHTPRTDHVLTGQAIADFAKSVWAAYPDMRLEVISRGDTRGALVATNGWLHGTHTGRFIDGTPPTGRTVAYPGASFTQVEGDKIRSEHTYLDRQTVAEQLGLKAK
jgi:predicted ester cyclase